MLISSPVCVITSTLSLNGESRSTYSHVPEKSGFVTVSSGGFCADTVNANRPITTTKRNRFIPGNTPFTVFANAPRIQGIFELFNPRQALQLLSVADSPDLSSTVVSDQHRPVGKKKQSNGPAPYFIGVLIRQPP